MVSFKAFVGTPFLMLLAACSSASGSSNNTNASAPVSGNAVSATPIAASANIGVNVNTSDVWQNSRPFMNLIYGGSFGMQNTNPYGPYEAIPASSLDANGWVTSVPAGYRVVRTLSVPAAGGNFVCRFVGNGTLSVSGPVSNVSTGAGATTFTIAPTNPADQSAVNIAYTVDPTNYIRNIDCREANASTTDNIAPEYIAALKGFKVVRFMKWQVWNGDATHNITWTNRNKPGDADYQTKDGVPIEVIVEAANRANVDPWINIPWNADNDYVTHVATYVRDNLAPGHQAYVELSNEVWNWVYPVATQAAQEGAAEGLPSSDGGAFQQLTERYAEKTAQVMDIWSGVFTGQTNRIVRVFAHQHVQPYYSNEGLAFNNTYQHVDALATASYWGMVQSDYTGQSLDTIMNTILPSKITEMLGFATQQKAVAQKYGLRYISYEGGQGMDLPNNLALLQQIERDSRMSTLYNQYLSAWQSQIGDTVALFALQGQIGTYGGWGLTEYIGQPLTQAPKMNAVASFLGLTTATSTKTTMQVCPDGTKIPITSTCPTSGTTTGTTTGGTTTGSTGGTTTGGTTTGSPGKKKGKGAMSGVAIV